MNHSIFRAQAKRATLFLLAAASLSAGLYCNLASAQNVTGLQAAITRVKPSIVAVGTFMPVRNPAFQFRGTGFVVGDGRLIATNAHVVPSEIDTDKKEVLSIAIPQADGKVLLREATLVERDTEHDLLLLRINGAPLPSLTMGNSDQVGEGQLYGFIGFPAGSLLGLYAATHSAMISAISPAAIPQTGSRQLDTEMIRRMRTQNFSVFQLDATAYPGNSGSPLFDPVSGAVVAVVNSILVTASKDNVTQSVVRGIAYAVPINLLRPMLEKALATAASNPAQSAAP
jgi:S1-C subfamily serine protease